VLLQQIAIYAIIGTIMDYTGYDWTTSIYWCMLVLVLVSNYLARKDGYDEATELAQAVWRASRAALEQAQNLNNKNNPEQQ
jgi:hypothetical protein